MAEFFYPTQTKLPEFDFISPAHLEDLTFLGFDAGVLASLRIAYPQFLADLEKQYLERDQSLETFNKKARQMSTEDASLL